MYIAIRRYQIDGKSIDEVTRHVRGPFLSLLKQQPDFLGYYWLKLGDTVYASISIYKDQIGAEESTRLAADYVKQHLEPLISKRLEIQTGEVLVAETIQTGSLGT